jgi:hypothetical protein
MWFLLLTQPDQHQIVNGDARLLKIAWLETMHHSALILGAARYARHEVERFQMHTCWPLPVRFNAR